MVSPYANNPYSQTSYTGSTLYNYNNTGNASYGLYGNNPSQIFAESPYARMTGQTTSLSAAAIPNLATYQQPMTVDMNAFLGNTGIPKLPSFIGSTAMNNPETPLFTSAQQYQQTRQPVVQQPPVIQTQNQVLPQQAVAVAQPVQNQSIFATQSQQQVTNTAAPIQQTQQPVTQQQNNNLASNITALISQFATTLTGMLSGNPTQQQAPIHHEEDDNEDEDSKVGKHEQKQIEKAEKKEQKQIEKAKKHGKAGKGGNKK